MALNIKNEETHRLAQVLAEETGETLTEAVTVAVRERLESLHRRHRRHEVVRSVQEIQEFVLRIPDRDRRSAEETSGTTNTGFRSKVQGYRHVGAPGNSFIGA
jgi:antitoxin VapB